MLIILVLISIVPHLKGSVSQECPDIYKRFSLKHSFCLLPNPLCDIYSTEMSRKDIHDIVEAHNSYRSKFALGKEKLHGHSNKSIPEAADMLEMVWDSELAIIAQRWAEQCNPNPDCLQCRQVVDYPVGQIIWKFDSDCSNRDCQAFIPNWKSVVEHFNREMLYYCHKKDYEAFDCSDRSQAQIIWAKSWRVGCGYVSYKQKNKFWQLYVCNYGPSVIGGERIYSEGKPCSDCPKNTCCGKSCNGSRIYPGLCRIIGDMEYPIYVPKLRKNTIKCDFASAHQPQCAWYTTGAANWKTITTHSGNITRIVLNGGESSTWHFSREFSLPVSSVAATVIYRKGPNVADQMDANNLNIIASVEGLSIPQVLPKAVYNFFIFEIIYRINYPLKFSITFSTPSSAPPQYLELKSFIVSDLKEQLF